MENFAGVIARRLTELRTAAGMTRAQVARALEVDQSQPYRWETGKGVPSTETLLKLADLYHCTVDTLLGRDTAADAASRKERTQ